MGKRIYFVSGSYETGEDPNQHLAYWDAETGEISRFWPNVEHDLGAGYMARRDSGELVVMGPRSYHWVPYTNLISGGDWWSGDVNREFLTSDVVLYTLDQDLQNPTPLLTDNVSDGGAWWGGQPSPEGWQPQTLYPPLQDFDDYHAQPFISPEGQILIAGWRFKPWETDPYQGSMFHVYNADGTLVRRDFPQGGEGPTRENDHVSSLDVEINWAAYDRTRGCLYYYDSWGMWRYVVATGETAYAPAVFPWVTTQAGWEQWRVAELRGNPDYLVQGPYPYTLQDGTPAYSYIEQKDYWRSRQAWTFAVEERTGYLWAITHGYEPYGMEYAEPGDGTPLSSSPGGYGQAGEKFQLICMDWNKFTTIAGDAATRDNPYPDLDFLHRFTGPHSEPPQIAADVKIIDLTHGKEHVALAPDDPLRAGWNTYRTSGSNLYTTNKDLSDASWLNTGVTLNPGVPYTVPFQALAGSDTTAADITGTDLYIVVIVADGSMGTVSIEYTGTGGTHSVGTLDTANGTSAFPSVPLTDQLKNDLIAGAVSVKLTLTSGTSMFVTQVYASLNYLYHDPSANALWQFGTLTLPADEPGFGYYSIEVPHWDAVAGHQDMLWAVYRINLDTGVAVEVFRNLYREPPDPPDADPNQFWLTHFVPLQLLVVNDDGTVVIPTIDPNLAAELKDLGQRFSSVPW